MRHLATIVLSSMVLLFAVTTTQAECTCQEGRTSYPQQIIDPLQGIGTSPVLYNPTTGQ